MGNKSKLVAWAVGASLMLGTFGLAACAPENDDKTGNIPEDIFAVYTAYAEEAGDNALSYDDWYADLLAHAKGEKGDKGDKGTNGKSAFEIWLEQEGNAEKTEEEFFAFLMGDPGDDGKSAFEVWLEQEGNEGKTEEQFFAFLKGDKGDDGKSAFEVWLEQEGNEGKTEEQFFAFLKGDKGDAGKDGTKWYTDAGNPQPSLGAEGDFYLDTQSFNLYIKDEHGWNPLGCIKGADGKDGAGAEQSAGYKLELGASSIMKTVPISDVMSEVKPGAYVIEVDLGEKTLTEGGELTAQYTYNSRQTKTTFVLSETRSQQKHNVYCGFFEITEGEDSGSLTFTAQNAEVNASVTVKEYEMPTLAADGQAVEVPIIYNNGMLSTTKFSFKIDDSVEEGQYTINCTRLMPNDNAVIMFINKSLTPLINGTASFQYEKENQIGFLLDNNSSIQPFRLAKVTLTAKV